jgi:hypothetical protein
VTWVILFSNLILEDMFNYYLCGWADCVKNSGSSSYVMGNGWELGQGGKVRIFSEYFKSVLNFLLVFLQILTLLRKFLIFLSVFNCSVKSCRIRGVRLGCLYADCLRIFLLFISVKSV